ncbi:MAG: YdgA family protein [Gammaproteobacteria bacterium]|nr:YdgA family protein [Gammaproteobacteria bacterium]
MRKYLILFLVAAVALIAAQVVVGKKTETYYQALVDQVRDEGGELLSHHYDRGWFGAAAETRFQLPITRDLPASGPGVRHQGFIVRSEISHGPVTSNGAGLAEITSKVQPLPDGLLPESYTVELHTFVTLNGKGDTKWILPPAADDQASSGVSVSFAGLDGELQFDPAAKTAEWKLNSPGLRVTGKDQVTVRLGEISVRSNSWVGNSGLTLGSGRFGLDEFSVDNATTGWSLRAQGVTLDLDSSEQENRVSGATVYAIQRLETQGVVYGPGSLRLELTNLSGSGLVRIQQAVHDLSGHPMSDAQRSMALTTLLMSVAPDILAQDPGFAVKDLRVVTPDGLIEGGFSIRSLGLRWEQVSLGLKALRKLEGELSFKMPESVFTSLLEALVAQRLVQERENGEESSGNGLDSPEQWQALVKDESQETLARLLRQQFLVRKSGNLVSNATLSNGEITVNGRVFPLL